ncbi:MAG: chorismate pyruvate-lyase family protein [Desulfococcaceae bacterium]|jgi:chorismate-pyruvate lyase|nr:chorismate pyruvate-lyase family protein [Desulfococcaceae bacterium]
MLLQQNIENVTNEFKLDLPGFQEFFIKGPVNLSELNIFQKILLTSDGTLTEIIEAYISDNIHVVKLSEELIQITADLLSLDIQKGKKVINRKILLQGRSSSKNWLYAESVIVPDRLEVKFKDELMKSRRPIGKLWRKYKIETFKEIIEYSRESAGQIADYFGINKEDSILSRTYRVFSRQKPIMMITEKFPESYYQFPVKRE